MGLKRFKEIPLKQLDKAPWNYKTDNDELKEKLKENLRRNGQVENIVVREMKGGRYEIVNGNHRFDALEELSFEKVICYNLGEVSDKAARRLAIELNETRFETDRIKLAVTIKDIADEFDLSDISLTTPYELEELEAMVDLLDFDFDKFEEKELPPIDDGMIECPECGHKFKP